MASILLTLPLAIKQVKQLVFVQSAEENPATLDVRFYTTDAYDEQDVVKAFREQYPYFECDNRLWGFKPTPPKLTGGSVVINAGSGGTSGAGGNITIVAGGGLAAGGSVFIQTGKATNARIAGAGLELQAGQAAKITSDGTVSPAVPVRKYADLALPREGNGPHLLYKSNTRTHWWIVCTPVSLEDL